jgi:hypothetical protein
MRNLLPPHNLNARFWHRLTLRETMRGDNSSGRSVSSGGRTIWPRWPLPHPHLANVQWLLFGLSERLSRTVTHGFTVCPHPFGRPPLALIVRLNWPFQTFVGIACFSWFIKSLHPIDAAILRGWSAQDISLSARHSRYKHSSPPQPQADLWSRVVRLADSPIPTAT